MGDRYFSEKQKGWVYETEDGETVGFDKLTAENCETLEQVKIVREELQKDRLRIETMEKILFMRWGEKYPEIFI